MVVGVYGSRLSSVAGVELAVTAGPGRAAQAYITLHAPLLLLAYRCCFLTLANGLQICLLSGSGRLVKKAQCFGSLERP